MSSAHEEKGLSLTLKIWRQRNAGAPGAFETHRLDSVSPDSSFLEMLDVLNDRLVAQGREPVVFDHDCREGICGSCGVVINGKAHGAEKETATCQLHMRKFSSGETIHIEPWRAHAFPVVRDLMVDRSAFDRVMTAGGYVSVNTGSPKDANALPIEKQHADAAFDAAACIGCGACVAACPNSAAMLFVGAKVTHLGHLPQGQPERSQRVLAMVAAMDAEGFGNCTNHEECSRACPKGISIDVIARLNRDYLKAVVVGRDAASEAGGGVG